MTTNEIRKKFLDFFKARGHAIVESDTLVPKEDPTVLFTTAGMQQFKRQFLGQITGYTRAASSQKCLRTDDLDKVGKTAYHHTFFEMLGNFSFGDYFKKDAIAWAWEFLTKELGIREDKLWVSVYKEDNEAEKIWLSDIKLPKQRLVKLGDKSNFWPAEAKTKGPNGPCGPCSEIFFDYGTNVGCGKKTCSPACDCGRFSEIWNLVFTQFNRKEDASLEPLPNKNIDTGMGLERLVAVLQGKSCNFETDLFAGILSQIDKEIGKNLKANERYLIADHIRAIVIGIADGVVPSNENRGYVIKRLIIDATDLAASAGQNKPSIHRLVPAVAESLKAQYPELAKKQKEIAAIVRCIEEGYMHVRKERIPELKHRAEKGEDLGQLFFDFRDTYGLTLGTIIKTVSSIGIDAEKIKKAQEKFEKLMDQQKERSRQSSKMTGDVFTNIDMNLDVPKTVFFGYTDHKATAKILKIFSGNTEVNEAKKGEEVKVILDQTPFYAESGGQIGDTGTIMKKDASLKVTDTQRISDVFIHIGKVAEGTFKVNDKVETQIDSKRRLSIMRNHTATHLLQAALRTVLGSHVKQQGSLVTDERLRFDFAHPKAVSKDEIAKIEHMVNDYILSCHDVKRETVSLEEARKKGALAFFAEKYSENVNVVSIGDFSKELCGGTHLQSIGEIGLFKIICESAIAQGIRRIEAKTGLGALEYVNAKEQQLDAIAQLLKAPAHKVTERIKTQAKRLKEAEKQLGELRFDAMKSSFDQMINDSKNIKGAAIVRHIFNNIPSDILRRISDALKQKVKSGVIALGSDNNNEAFILIAVTDDLVKKDIKANEIINQIAPIIDGSGGGRPQMAQAGSKNTAQLKKALQETEAIIEGKLRK